MSDIPTPEEIDARILSEGARLAERYGFNPVPAVDGDGQPIDDGIAIVHGPDGPRLAIRLAPSADCVTLNLTTGEEI